MQTVYSPRHAGHGGNVELMPGAIVPAFELPRRAEIVRARVRGGRARAGRWRRTSTTWRRRGGCMRRTISTSCRAPGRSGRRRAGRARRCPSSGRCRGCAPTCRPTDIDGLLGFYAMDARRHLRRGHLGRGQGEPRRGADRRGAGAGRGGRRLRALPPAGAPCRARASRAATASSTTRRWRRSGCARRGRRGSACSTSTITTATARRRSSTTARDVQVVNIHADPMVEYPYFLGHADERGERRGRGVQPEPAAAARHRTSRPGRRRWRPAARRWRTFAPEVLVVSLGVDTFRGDPISRFRLDTPDYPVIGARHPRRSGCRRSS